MTPGITPGLSAAGSQYRAHSLDDVFGTGGLDAYLERGQRLAQIVRR